MESKALPSTRLDQLALLISALFSPYVICAVFAGWIIYHYTSSLQQFLLLSATFVFFSVLVVFSFVTFRVKQGKYTDIHVAVRAQRDEVFQVATVSAGLLAGIFYLEDVALAITAMAITLFINGVLFWVISRSWKISMHAAAIAQASVTAAILITPKALVFYLALPLVAWARLHRKRHSAPQTIAAAFIVTITTTLIFWGLNLLEF